MEKIPDRLANPLPHGTILAPPASLTLNPPDKPDTQLIKATLAGNSAAFGELVIKYQDRLYNSMVYVVDSAAGAQDIVQDAFVQAFVKLHQFRGSSSFYTWLYRIAFNMAASCKRREKSTVSVEDVQSKTGHEPTDEAQPPESLALRQERISQVRKAILTLSEEHRAVLVLRDMEGSSYEVIAQVLQVPVGTVRSRLHRARMLLREQLRNMLEEGWE